MKGTVHMAITIALITVVKTYTDINIDSLMVMGAVIGSFLPDTDIKYSKAGKVIPVWLIAKHRGFTHSIFTLVVLSAIAGYFSFSFGIGLFIGYGLHLLADLTTPMRLPAWDFPFGRWNHGKANKSRH